MHVGFDIAVGIVGYAALSRPFWVCCVWLITSTGRVTIVCWSQSYPIVGEPNRECVSRRCSSGISKWCIVIAMLDLAITRRVSIQAIGASQACDDHTMNVWINGCTFFCSSRGKWLQIVFSTDTKHKSQAVNSIILEIAPRRNESAVSYQPQSIDWCSRANWPISDLIVFTTISSLTSRGNKLCWRVI